MKRDDSRGLRTTQRRQNLIKSLVERLSSIRTFPFGVNSALEYDYL